MLATAPHCAASGVNGFALPPFKRKRSDSSDSAIARDAPVAAKVRTDDTPPKPISFQQQPSTRSNDGAASTPTEHPTGRISERTVADPSSGSSNNGDRPDPSMARDNEKATPRKVDVDRLRETLEAQLSLEVLLKHNELRLIDQEIAKCQVALEQLRRCAEIPYPGSQAAGLSQSVSAGTGVSVWGPGNGPAPLSPAPWGVVDGPYTRHYSRWLLPDPRFNGGEVEPATPMGAGAMTPMEGRSTRGNPIDSAYLAGKTTRPQRGSTGAKLQSLPSGYPAPKERAGPMIIRRKSDNVLVKLVCLDCRRDNFSSTQGFINHCRIAHNRNFASHDAAAVASGEPVEVDEAGAVVGGKSEPTTGVSPGFVHPLIRSAHVIESAPRTPSASDSSKRASQSRSLSAVETPRITPPQTPLKPKTPTMAGASNEAFTASEDTPHLSSLMKLRGVGLDLSQLVGESKTTVDLDGYSSEESESESEPTPSAEAKASSKPLATRAGRQPMRTTASQTASQRPDGHKGVDKPNPKPLSLETMTPPRPPVPYQSPYAPTDSQMNGLPEVDGVELSPNTAESNQAPSLVSDDDDFEAGSESDSPGPSSSEAEDGEGDFSLVDVEDDDDATGSTTTSDSNPKPDVGMASGAKSMPRGNIRKKGQFISSSVVSLSRGKDEKRVSFTISLSTFRTLLAHYEATVHRVTRRKTIAKQTGKKGKPKARAPKKRKASQEEEEDNGVKEGGEDGKAKEITPEVSAQVDAADREFWELDTWRYETLPGVLRERLQEGKEKKGGKGVSLSKDEAVKLMEWKLKHGIHRPALLGMLKSNPERSIQSATTTAFASLPATPDNPTNPLSSESTKETLDTTFSPLLTSLNALSTPLRGIGPATASLFLSVASPSVPFYSDDTYLWLVVETHPVWDRAEGVGDWVRGEVHEEKKKMVRPNGELLVKYNVAEYRALWEAVRWLRGRLNGEKRALGSEGKEEGEEISCADVEKVAFVVRHAGESGLKGEGVVDTVKDDGRVEKDEKEGAGRKRRKVRK
ncbi:hypothetical protein BJX63DRAFT_419487 [Aspergillus granulosus]|uniref:AHC1-like C2H2 zinc-finger domain-containing protein n=1 Tax=Aspergillus granulosus TaxID=176169 RepID=A0ABR4HT10_9EURO